MSVQCLPVLIYCSGTWRSCCEDHGIFWQRFGKFCIIFTALHASVTARHDYEFLYFPGLYRCHYFICQRDHLAWAKPPGSYQFQFFRRRTFLCLFYDLGKSFFLLSPLEYRYSPDILLHRWCKDGLYNWLLAARYS